MKTLDKIGNFIIEAPLAILFLLSVFVGLVVGSLAKLGALIFDGLTAGFKIGGNNGKR